MSNVKSETAAESSEKVSESQAGENNSGLSRRTFGKGAAVLGGAGAAGIAFLLYGSQAAIAVDNPDEWIANSAQITTQDGTIDSVTFGDPDEIDGELEDDDNRLIVEWEGFSSGEHTADFSISIAGADDGDDVGWTGGAEPTPETEPQELATGDGTIEGTNGSDAFTWLDVFGESQPVDVTDHDDIIIDDFFEDDAGEERVRELTVFVEVEVAEQGVSAEEDANATISVSNLAGTIEVGGEGTFEIESDEEVEEPAED